MKKPLIGITCTRVNYTEAGPFWGTAADGIHQHYAAAVRKAGGVPVLLPITTDREEIKQLCTCLDGVVLTGGVDVDPLLYNEQPHQHLGATMHDRDVFEISVARCADMAGLPMLGICRGCQVLNVTFGGTLYQDLGSQVKNVQGHSQQGSPLYPSQTVNICKNSILHSLYGDTTMINSLHHQAVKDVAKGFFAAATAEDGVIEAIERKEGFVLGLQWHPEWLTAGNFEKAVDIFKLLITAAQK